jgi:hypothetical protein
MFGLFFAAGAGITDIGAGDTGGGDNGGDVDPGAGDGGEGDDAGVDEGGSDDRGDVGDVDDEADPDARGENDTDPNAPVDIGDGRQVPGKFKKLFDLAKKAGLEKEAKQLYFANQRLSKAIPGGINAAIQMAKSVEELGGLDGVQQLQEDLASHTEDAELFNSGDARWVENGFQENPESSLKLFAHSLDYVAENHPDHYNHYMAKVIINDLSNLHLHEIHSKLSALKDDPNAKQLAKEIADYWNSRLETSKVVPEKKVDAATQKLTEREKQVEKREMDTRFTEVNRGAFPALQTAVNNSLKTEAKRAGIDLAKLSKDYPGEWRDLLNDIHQRVMKTARKDQRFIDKYYAHVKTNDLKRALAAINKKHESLVPDAVRAAVADRGLFRKGKAGAGGTGDKGGKPNTGGSGDKNTAAAGWARVSQRPANSSIDWNRTTTALQLDGKYILKDGKKVVVSY